MENSRKFTVKLLTKLDNNSSYSNILLSDALDKSKLSNKEKKFASALFYGVLERRITLDEVIISLLKNPKNKLDTDVRNILRTAIYQLVYMDSVPDSAAVDEAVKLAKKNKNPAVSGFVNGILREFIRRNKALPTKKDPLERLALEYSAPLWLVKKWDEEYGSEVCVSMLKTSLGAAPTAVKANTLKLKLSEIISVLRTDGFECEQISDDIVKDCLKISGSGSIEKSRAYQAGLIHVQDISCQLCCKALEVKAGETMLDICSAPGGKTFTCAELMGDRGSIYAFDLHKNRVELINNGASLLGLNSVKAGTNDGKKFNDNLPKADKVLCDVPCSGLGVIRRKPEIKYKDQKDFERLPEIQFDILSVSSKYVKAGGILVYSTCTLSKAENDEVAERFLDEYTDFEPLELPEPLSGSYKATITPDRFDSDGFFIARFRRKG